MTINLSFSLFSLLQPSIKSFTFSMSVSKSPSTPFPLNGYISITHSLDARTRHTQGTHVTHTHGRIPPATRGGGENSRENI